MGAYQKRGARRGLKNSLANVMGAMCVFFIALELERLLEGQGCYRHLRRWHCGYYS
jgi:hypothetical protein